MIGEATAGALIRLLPPGYSISVLDVKIVARDDPQHVFATVEFQTPTHARRLHGIAPNGDILYLAVARAVLNATNRLVEPLLPVSA